MLEKLWAKFEKYIDVGTTFNLKDNLWNLFLYEKGMFQIPDGLDKSIIYDGCNCGNCHITILPNGDVYACRRMESRIGNVLEDNLYDLFTGEVWKNPGNMAGLRNVLNVSSFDFAEVVRW